MKLVLLLTFVLSVSLCLGSPADNSLLVRERRQFDLYENSKVIIQELLTNLRNATQLGVNSITTLSSGLQDLGAEFRKKLGDDVEKYKNRIIESINNITATFGEVGSEVRECIDEHRKEAENLFTGIVSKSKACADYRIKDIGRMIIRLKYMTINATNYINNSIEEMHNCTQSLDGILSTGACLGRIAIRTEIKGAIFVTQSGLLIARINIALAALPSALEICAGTSIVEAGVGSAKVIMEIGSCSALSAYNTFTGHSAVANVAVGDSAVAHFGAGDSAVAHFGAGDSAVAHFAVADSPVGDGAVGHIAINEH